MKIRNVTTTIVLSLVCLSMSANADIVEVGDGLGATLEDHLFDNFSDGGGAINANGDFFATYTVVDPTIGTFTFDYLVEGVAGGPMDCLLTSLKTQVLPALYSSSPVIRTPAWPSITNSMMEMSLISQ